MVIVNFKQVCSAFLHCICGLINEFMALFMVFNLWNDPGFIFEPCN